MLQVIKKNYSFISHIGSGNEFPDRKQWMKESDPFRPRVTLTFELHTWQKGVAHTLTIVMICCKLFGTFFIYYKVVNRTSIWSVTRTGWPLTLSYKLGKCATHRLNMVVVGGQTMQTHCKKSMSSMKVLEGQW